MHHPIINSRPLVDTLPNPAGGLSQACPILGTACHACRLISLLLSNFLAGRLGLVIGNLNSVKGNTYFWFTDVNKTQICFDLEQDKDLYESCCQHAYIYI
jgi:hypothetical protein